MEQAHLRELQYTNQCELVFSLKIVSDNGVIILEADLRSVRQLGDSVHSLLQHTKNKIVNLLENQEGISLNISLTKNGTNVDSDTSCLRLIQEFSKPIGYVQTNNLIFKVCDQTFAVVVNAPLITRLDLPNSLFVGHRIQTTKFKALFTEKHLCLNTWFVSSDKLLWKSVGNDFKYTPKLSDVNNFLKLVCVPCNTKGEGTPFEVVSTNTIQEMCPVPKCPFEDRHQFTKNKLNGSSIRIVSYNTLSTLYCDIDQFPYCTFETLSIEYRKQLILKEIIGYNADIICLQELDCFIFKNYLQRKLPPRYKGVFHKKGERLQEGLAIFYSSYRFRCIKEVHIVVAEQLKSNALFKSLWKMLQLTPNLADNVLSRLTSLQLCVLQSIKSRDVIVVANTHLYFHSEARDVRLIQARLAVDIINKFVSDIKKMNKHLNVGVIFCGDFNSVPESPLYNFMNTGVIEHTFEDNGETSIPNTTFTHPFQFASAYGEPKYTNYTQDFKGCLDYIFYEKDKFNLIENVPLPDERVLSENTALPSHVFPSDHLALVTTLEML